MNSSEIIRVLSENSKNKDEVYLYDPLNKTINLSQGKSKIIKHI
jgi:hypothetical protein